MHFYAKDLIFFSYIPGKESYTRTTVENRKGREGRRTKTNGHSREGENGAVLFNGCDVSVRQDD